MRIFLTGGVGFIGFHTAQAFLALGHMLTVIDELTPYYDPAVVHIVEAPFSGASGQARHRIYNLGNSHPQEVSTLIHLIELATGKNAKIENAEGPAGDVRETYADITKAAQDFGFVPKISLAEGIPRFVEWYRKYHRI